jgi:hypothetical protein
LLVVVASFCQGLDDGKLIGLALQPLIAALGHGFATNACTTKKGTDRQTTSTTKQSLVIIVFCHIVRGEDPCGTGTIRYTFINPKKHFIAPVQTFVSHFNVLSSLSTCCCCCGKQYPTFCCSIVISI